MQVKQLSTNGFALTEVFDAELLAEICNACDAFSPKDTRPGFDGRRESIDINLSPLRKKIIEAISSIVPDKISGIELWRDYPGYMNPFHLDDPTVENIIIVYLGDEELDIGTGFTEGQDFSVPYKKNTGIMLLKSNKIQHGMIGTVPENVVRKTLYINWRVKPATLCLAPWTHTYLSPQTERRMCCASREPAQNFKQYIDTSAGTGKYIPLTLEEHWNGEHMRSVRRRMMAGETLPECEVCNDKLLNTSVYRSYFDSLFGHKYSYAMNNTSADGSTTLKPVSWDYRFSNLCNFKCRMCGDMLSSSWETEQRQHNMVNWDNPKNAWMLPEVKKQIESFQQDQIEAEFSEAVEQHRVEEVYWVGGEPLMYEQHWRYMKRIVELGDGKNVYARYNTNLSRVDYRGTNLYRDILPRLRDWQICASLDGTGAIGEYIRTGLDYNSWLENFAQGVQIATNPRQMRIDFTLTLPGMFEVERIERLSATYSVQVLAKVIFSFSPDIVMSPLALPRELLDPWIDETISKLAPNGVESHPLKDILVQLKTRPTFQEQWPNEYKSAIAKGKERVLKLEQIRTQPITMTDILAQRPEVLKWWMNIETI